jgi:1,4-alpha-glucan branching enzyme
MSLAGEGYLNFMGNEFGHPEWIDFPREGNGWSYKYARRQWSLADNGYLKYGWLQQFDIDMLRMEKKYRLLGPGASRSLWIDQENKLIAYERRGLVFVFNFHPERSEEAFFVPTQDASSGEYRVILSTDRPEYGGTGRIDEEYRYAVRQVDGRGNGFEIYVPCRTAIVLKRV